MQTVSIILVSALAVVSYQGVTGVTPRSNTWLYIFETLSACFVATFTCPPDYRFNPYALTCVKLVTQQKRWSEAKLHCEQTEGGFLMTPATTQSAMWLREQHRIGDWRGDGSVHVWIGGYKNDDGVFEWQGLNTGPVTVDFWEPTEPSGGSERCIVQYDIDRATWNDAHCEYHRGSYFFCEKLPSHLVG